MSKPEFTGHLMGSSVKEGDWNYQADFAANIPLVRDKLGLRLIGYHQYQSGIFDREHVDYLGFPTPDFATKENVYDYTVNGAQAALKYRASDSLSFNARVNYQNLEGNALPYADLEAGNYVNQRAFDVHEYYEDEWIHLSAGFDATFGAGNLVGVFAHWERDTLDVEDMSELMAWLGFFAGIPVFIPPLETPWPNVDNADSDVAELRFTSSFDGPVDFTAVVAVAETVTAMHSSDPQRLDVGDGIGVG